MPEPWEQVPEEHADAGVAALYESIRRGAGLSHVAWPWRVLAARPRVLRATWGALQPLVLDRRFGSIVDALRAQTVARLADEHPPLLEPPLLEAGLDVDAIDAFRDDIALFHHDEPRTLVCGLLLADLLSDRPRRPGVGAVTVGDGSGGGDRDAGGIDVPPHWSPPSLPPGVAMRVEPMLRRCRDEVGVPSIPGELRALAHRPAALARLWELVGPSVSPARVDARLVELVAETRLGPVARLVDSHRADAVGPTLSGDDRSWLTEVAPFWQVAAVRRLALAAVLRLGLEGCWTAQADPWGSDEAASDDHPTLDESWEGDPTLL